MNMKWTRFLLFSIFVISSIHTGLADVESIDIGSKVSDFTLPDARTGKQISLSEARGSEGTAIIFIATGCPYSNAFNSVMADLAGRYEKRGIKVIGVNSNKTEATQKVADHADANNFGFVVMKDEGSVIADRFGASVTPEVFLIDGEMELRYHGALGNSRQPTRKAEEANSDDVVQALEALLSGAGVPVKTTKMFGCTIKR